MGVFFCACLFLGIKGVEYYGKYEHDILPGHVAESREQAFDKLKFEMEAAVNAQVNDLRPDSQVQADLESQAEKEGRELSSKEISESIAFRPDQKILALQQELSNLNAAGKLDESQQERKAELEGFFSFYDQYKNLRDHINQNVALGSSLTAQPTVVVTKEGKQAFRDHPAGSRPRDRSNSLRPRAKSPSPAKMCRKCGPARPRRRSPSPRSSTKCTI